MKILSASQIYQADQATIQREPISSLDLMERAGLSCFNWIMENVHLERKTITIFCGLGNNGGDGLVIARMMLEKGFDVTTYLVKYSDKSSDDFAINLKRLQDLKPRIVEISNEDTIPEIADTTIVIDAIFGIGLKRPLLGFTKSLVTAINNSTPTRISIDIPSGLYLDKKVSKGDAVIKADEVLTFQSVKLSFLLPDNEQFIGTWQVLDIGLDTDFLHNVESPYHLLELNDLKKIYKKRSKFSHKGTYGHSLIIGGSFGKVGAVILASKAALKAGSGLVSSYIPKCGYTAMQSHNPEVMVEVDDENYLQFFNFKTEPTAIGIGPGLGLHPKTKKGFVKFIAQCAVPLVIDADALNILSEYEELSDIIPKGSVLTPHPKEFERLVGGWDNDYEKLDKLKHYSNQHDVVVVLKGAYTAITYQGKIWFNNSGNPALATAGSGDVLTGIITSLLAQGYPNIEAALFGVYLHGRTADLAIISRESMESFTASTSVSFLGESFKELSSY